MSFKIEKTKQLQINSQTECPLALMEGPMEGTLKTYRLLNEFLEACLLEPVFKEKEDLQKALNDWPEFVRKNKFICDEKFKEIVIFENHISCVDVCGEGWEFILGEIKKEA